MKPRGEVVQQFREAVNMGPEELQAWLDSEQSRSVGWHQEGEEEAVGHQSGRRIVDILQTPEEEWGDEEVAHMQQVVAYMHRHMAQRHHLKKQDPEHSRWRYSLMNWGHDPLKDDESEAQE